MRTFLKNSGRVGLMLLLVVGITMSGVAFVFYHADAQGVTLQRHYAGKTEDFGTWYDITLNLLEVDGNLKVKSFVAQYIVNPSLGSPHCTGSVSINVFDENNQEVGYGYQRFEAIHDGNSEIWQSAAEVFQDNEAIAFTWNFPEAVSVGNNGWLKFTYREVCDDLIAMFSGAVDSFFAAIDADYQTLAEFQHEAMTKDWANVTTKTIPFGHCPIYDSSKPVLFDGDSCSGNSFKFEEDGQYIGNLSSLGQIIDPIAKWMSENMPILYMLLYFDVSYDYEPTLQNDLQGPVTSVFVPSGWTVFLLDVSQKYSLCTTSSIANVHQRHFPNSEVNIGGGLDSAVAVRGSFCDSHSRNIVYQDPQSIVIQLPDFDGSQGSPRPLNTTTSSMQRTCSDVSMADPGVAYTFSETTCNGELTWFSAHPENGPSANSVSLYVPSNSVVKVSSQDNGGGETACFTSTQTDLGAWRNKIQWAQLVPGGSCPVVTADGYLIHTNQGDFWVNNGQTWDNTQHNRQIWGFDRQGSVHLKINHVNGAQRCWDESKTAQQLQNDGDWWIQTRSIVIGSGYCPGMSGQLEVYSLANFQGGRHDIRAGNLRTYPDNDLKYSLRFTQPGMSVKLTNAAGRTRCWNTNIANLQDHEDYWNRTTKIEVFGSDVCPKPVEVPAGANFAPGSNVKYTYYEYIAPMVGLPIPNVWTPVSTGYAGNFAINQVPHRDNDFAIRFESCLTVPTTGSYTFYTTSDDGSKLYINGQNIVDNDGYHSSSEKSGTVNLTAGVHSIAVDFFEGGVEQMLGVAWQGPNFAKQWMPNQQLAMTGCSWELKKQLPTIKPDMFAIAKSGLTAGTTGVKLLTGSSNFSTVQGTYPTYVEEDTRQNYAWAFELADYNFDGTVDVYAFKKTGTGSGMTELHILNGASNYRSFALQTPTTLGATGYDYVWDFELGDYDKDGRLDAFAINKKYTGQRKVELHILKGAGNFQTWCAHIVTALPELSSLDYWDFELADYDGDKNLDLFAFNKTGTASGKIELSILKGPTFSSIAVQQQLPISTIFSATNRQLELADYSGDGVQDLYVVDSVGSTGVVEVTVWDGNGTFQNRLASLLTAQPNVSDGGTRWLFRFARLKGQILGASLSDGAGETLPDTVAPVDNVPVNLLFLPLISN